MLFEEIKPCLINMDQEQAAEFFQSYWYRREIDLSTPSTFRKTRAASVGPKKKKEKQVKVTPEELKVLQKMGLI